jgi:hypothetical protein
MRHASVTLALAACLVLAGAAWGQATAPPLVTTTGLVEKADKDGLTIRPREPGGRFGKSVVLKVTGTTKVTTVSVQKRAGNNVLVQREVEVKDLERNQPVAVIYTTATGGPVLLAAVVQPAAGK